jgi:hypothetical protein
MATALISVTGLKPLAAVRNAQVSQHLRVLCWSQQNNYNQISFGAIPSFLLFCFLCKVLMEWINYPFYINLCQRAPCPCASLAP